MEEIILEGEITIADYDEARKRVSQTTYNYACNCIIAVAAGRIVGKSPIGVGHYIIIKNKLFQSSTEMYRFSPYYDLWKLMQAFDSQRDYSTRKTEVTNLLPIKLTLTRMSW